jgi:adhesin/invasin
VNIVGEADEVTLIAFKDTVQTSGSSGDVADCVEDSDINDATDLLGEPNITVVQATVVDNDGTELARVSVFDDDTLSNGGVGSSDNDIAEPADGSPISGTSGQTVVTDAGTAFYQIICGGTDTGEVTITAFIDDGSTDGDNDSVTLNVVGEPANIALTAAPAQIACDGTATSTVPATVTDSEGNNVANGVAVNFSVVALGTANPINTSTTDGTASSTITPLSNASAGVTVIVTSGDAQSSIRVDCSVPIPTQPTAVPSGTPGGTIRPPDTGNGGYLGQDGSAGFPVWALIALAAGTVALVAGGMVTRKAGR